MSAPPRTRAALITFAPVRRATSEQYAGPSSPCSCTTVSPTPSAMPVTSSSGALTNTPQTSTWRRSVAAMRSASGSGQRRAEPGNRMTPSAHAPASTARLASSRPVIPQNLMRGGRGLVTPASYGLSGPLRLRWARGERDLDGPLAAVVEQVDLDLVALLLARDRVEEVVAGAQLAAVDGSDDVAAEADLVVVDARDDVAALDAGLVSRAAGRDGLHEHAVIDGEVQVAERGVDRQRALDPEEAAVDLAGLLELGQQALRGVDRDREADADVAAAAAARLDLRVDADDAAGRVEQRTAGVAGVDRRVGLDDAVDLEAVRRLDRALGGRHDARRERALETERVADRDRRIADLDAARAAEGQRPQLALRRRDLQHREVGRLVAAEDAGVDDVLVGELDRHLRRAGDDVRVRQDRAVAVDHEAGARRLAALLLGEAEVEGRLRLLDDLGADEYHARSGALVDVARGQPGAARARGVVAAQRRLLDDRGRVAAAEAERDDQADRRRAAEHRGDRGDRDQRLPPHCPTSVGSLPEATLNRLLAFSQERRGSVRLGVAVEPGEIAAGGLRVGRAHEHLPDEHGVDADALEVVELLAGVEAGLRDDGLARRDVGEQLVRALDVDGEVDEVAVVDADDVRVGDLQRAVELVLAVDLDEHVQVEAERLAVERRQVVVAEGGDDQQDRVGAG